MLHLLVYGEVMLLMGKTDRIDSKYEEIIKRIFLENGSIQSLKKIMIDILTKKRIKTFESRRMG